MARDVAIDDRKAALWAVLAAAALVAIVLIGHIGYPYVLALLVGPAYLLMLPAIGALHPRMRAVRSSGAVLGTLAGLAAALIGLVATQNADLRPSALLALGMWWWTVGKMAAETAFVPRAFGLATALAGIVAIAGVPLEVFTPLIGIAPGAPELHVWAMSRIVLALWLVALAATLARRRLG